MEENNTVLINEESKKLLEEQLSTYDSFELEFGLEAIRFLATKNTTVEELVLKGNSYAVGMLILAGVKDHSIKEADEIHRIWVKRNKYKITEFLACLIIRLESNGGFFSSQLTMGVLDAAVEKMENPIPIMTLRIMEQNNYQRIASRMSSLKGSPTQ